MTSSFRGVTVIEILLALGILSIALLSLLATFTSGLKLSQVSNEVTTATTVGQEFLELAKVRGYAQTAVGTFDGRVPDTSAGVGFPYSPYPAVTRDGRTYTLVVSCSDVSATIRDIKVDVYWDNEATGKVSFYTRVHL